MVQLKASCTDRRLKPDCVIIKDGPKPINVGELSCRCPRINSANRNPLERVAIEAAISGDYDTALLAMTIRSTRSKRPGCKTYLGRNAGGT